jgi:hypothetical protein
MGIKREKVNMEQNQKMAVAVEQEKRKTKQDEITMQTDADIRLAQEEARLEDVNAEKEFERQKKLIILEGTYAKQNPVGAQA